ncbi:GNAT family N-acetyltransferase [Bacteroides oleiciplenus]|uniref:GNAT family N-acetyltransferase n=1 Tax=Bacteroides oleiciplenus TaxID=626931 RepID=UPI0026DBFB78|nr:hypothetical protein [Bacteroides oleiciplenus]
MKKLPANFEITRYGLHVRFVDENDAEFILKLRTNEKLSRFIHSTDNNIDKQKEWIRNYKIREANAEDYYFIFYKDGIPVGLNRIYGIHDHIFTTGSWIFDENVPFECAVVASIITRELAFEYMGLELEDGYDGVHVDNKKVIRFNKLIGLKETARIRDVKGEYIAMELTKADFEINKAKLLNLIGY